VPDVAAGECDLSPGGREVGGDLGTGVARADDQHRAGGELIRPPVVAGVELDDRGIELPGELG
jgi:hypothetical protein